VTPRPWHPYLFAVFPVVFLVMRNLGNVAAGDLVLAMLIIGSMVGFSLAVLKRILHDEDRAALIVTLWLLAFFSYGHLRRLMADSLLAHTQWDRTSVTLGIVFSPLLIGTLLAFRTSQSLAQVTRAFNIFAIALLATSVVPLVAVLRANRPITAAQADAPMRLSAGPEGLPDLYFLVLDGYANGKVLQEFYGFDNTDFLTHLREQGFQVHDNARSNYALTALSLAATLNFEHMTDVASDAGSASNDLRVPQRMIRTARAFRELRSLGYSVVHFSSGWESTDTSAVADIAIPCGPVSEFLLTLARTSLLRLLDEYTQIIGGRAASRVNCIFSRLTDLPRGQQPMAVFAHILSPHPPFVFAADGTVRAQGVVQSGPDGWHDKNAYVQQLRYINFRVQVLVGALALRGRQPVVVIQSDHGPASSGGWETSDPRLIRERMQILNAILIPGSSAIVPPDLTPVNTFRFLFNHYFNAKLDMLPNTTYFSTYEAPYDLREVDPGSLQLRH